MEDSLVSKNARFAHDMVNFESDVRRKRFSAHVAMKRMKFVLDEQEKSTPGNSEVLFRGSRGSRTPDPLLVRQTL